MRCQDRTHCVNGHPFTPANTERHVVRAVRSDGTHATYEARRCRACKRIDRLVHYYTKEMPRAVDLDEVVRAAEARMEGVLW